MSNILVYESYVQMIKNSIGTKMFRSLYIEKDGEKNDIADNGSFSCALFVSNVLFLWDLISSGHATVESTIEDMKKNGWKEVSVDNIKIGDVILWEEKLAEDNKKHYHNGFYIGDNQAISNSGEKGFPVIHDWKYNGKREIISVYTYPNFKK
ncbi:MAG: hypothetical protein GF387_00710 [Candidatus Portnoybacteria bacterium]|nr:hypothetical protein [Candidatus Portnoybacteria bacterium]